MESRWQHLFCPLDAKLYQPLVAGNIPYWRETYVRIDLCYNHLSRARVLEVEVFGGFPAPVLSSTRLSANVGNLLRLTSLKAVSLASLEKRRAKCAR